jgi:thiamine biosynthesis lipoprotein
VTPAPASCSFAALGTTAVVLVTEPAALARAEDAVRAEVAAIDLACSRFRDDSELVGLNQASGQPVSVSPLLLEAIEVAQRAARLTGGRVDPTIGRALRLIGYDRDFASVDPNGPPLTAIAVAAPGWQSIVLDRQSSTVYVPDGVQVDLGATAKALAADRAATAAAAAAATSTSAKVGVLVSLGGDIATAGEAPDGGWLVRVTDDHGAPADAPGQTIRLRAGGLATSSTTVRHWARGDEELHHLIDPDTGRPASALWRTVSVAASSCVDANIASTASMILGTSAPAWLSERRLPARLVAPDGEVVRVAGWPAEDEEMAEVGA